MAKVLRLGDLTPSQRLRAARRLTQLLVDHVAALIPIHAANALVLYSGTLSSQIPRSRAANAFNQFRTSMAGFEVIRLCACWGRIDPHDATVPTVLALSADKEVHDLIRREIEPERPGSVSRALADDVLKHLDEAVARATAVRADPRLNAVRNHRDRFFAHNLERTRLEDQVEVERMRHGDEAWLLEETRVVVDRLHRGLHRADFDWNGLAEMAERNAGALWGNCTFAVTAR